MPLFYVRTGQGDNVVSISDSTMQVIEQALDGLALRSETIATNVANAEVPGFRASRVSFESELRKAIESGDVDRFVAVVNDSGGAPDANGNTVQIEQEMIEMIKTNLMQATMADAFNFKIGLLRSALRGV